jgi:hypothetical protein
MLAILIGLLGIVLAVWLIPIWLLPWVVGIGILVWASYCVAQSGYPVIPTFAWAFPVAVAVVAEGVFHSPLTLIVSWVGIGGWLTLVLFEPARRFWYVKLFRWRPNPS